MENTPCFTKPGKLTDPWDPLTTLVRVFKAWKLTNPWDPLATLIRVFKAWHIIGLFFIIIMLLGPVEYMCPYLLHRHIPCRYSADWSTVEYSFGKHLRCRDGVDLEKWYDVGEDVCEQAFNNAMSQLRSRRTRDGSWCRAFTEEISVMRYRNWCQQLPTISEVPALQEMDAPTNYITIAAVVGGIVTISYLVTRLIISN
jgi:hypothetical protein